MLAVPWELALTSPLTAVSAHRVAPHHVEVVQQLLNTSHDDSQRAQFWRTWTTLLPPLAELPHPATLPQTLLQELQDRQMAADAQLTRAHVEAALRCTACDEAHWAMALVRSRPFSLPPPRNDGAARGIFAFVPLADMVNHDSDAPSCEIRAVGDKASPDRYTAV